MEQGNFWHKAERRRDKELEKVEEWRPNTSNPPFF